MSTFTFNSGKVGRIIGQVGDAPASSKGSGSVFKFNASHVDQVIGKVGGDPATQSDSVFEFNVGSAKEVIGHLAVPKTNSGPTITIVQDSTQNSLYVGERKIESLVDMRASE